jgi:hypothetical protein
MNRQDLDRFVQAGKTLVRTGTAAAWQISKQVSAEARRGAEIARPILREASRLAWAEAQRQAAAAKPVLQEAARRAAAWVVERARNAYGYLRPRLDRRCRHAVLLVGRFWQTHARAGRISLAGASLIVLAVLAGIAGGWFADDAPVAAASARPVVPEAGPTIFPPAPEPQEPQSIEAPPIEVPVPLPAQRDDQLALVRQQALAELQQAAAEYDYALNLWNAEVAACQTGPAPGYTPEQMGRLAAMGYRPHMQPQRQPNQALYHAAYQAEQRYLAARSRCQQLSMAP